MKKISIIVLLITAFLAGNAQEPIIKHKKKQNVGTTDVVAPQNVEATPSAEATPNATENQNVTPIKHDKDANSGSASISENSLLKPAIDNAFLIVKANYNVRDKESGSNISGNEFFGTVYSVIPLLPYGFGVDNRFLKPWKFDSKFDSGKYGDDMVSVDNREYRRLNNAVFVPYNLNQTQSQELASGFYHVKDSTFHNHGLQVEIDNGIKSGYMVWFRVDPENGTTSYSIVPTKITFNENSIFNVKQPSEPETVIGGAFINLSANEPGCLRLNLMAIARIDPYGGQKWELVKMQTHPDTPDGVQPASSNQKAVKSETSGSDDSIIPEQDNSKNKKKGKK